MMKRPRKITIKRRVEKQPHFTNLHPSEKIFGQKWFFHKGDDDPNPSVPHGHSEDGKYKLSLWDGKIYSIQSGNVVGTASKREMKALYSNKAMQQFIMESREWYMQNHPYCPELAPLRAQNAILKKVLTIRRKKEIEAIQVYIHYKLN